MKKVMVFGVFDIFHEGHKYFLQQARQYGDFLIVVLATDANVKKLKGRPPLHTAEERRQQLMAYVDEVIIGHETDFLQPLLTSKPDVICLGYDQTNYLDVLETYKQYFPHVQIIRLHPYHPEQYKSSYFREKRNT